MTRKKRAYTAVVIIIALILPLITNQISHYFSFAIGMTLLYMMWATGMHLTFGYTGMLPLMYAGLAGIGAYFSANMVLRFGMSFWIALPLAGVLAALVGMVLGLPSLRLRGFYFVLSTLVIQVALTLVFTQALSITGGDTGIANIPFPEIPLPGGEPFVIRDTSYYYLILIFLLLTIYAVYRIMQSDLGRKFIAIREDDILAETLGINVTRYKLISFLISSFIAGVGGSLYAHYVNFISPRSFDIVVSLAIWLAIMFGGRRLFLGPLIGALILTPIPYLLREIYPFRDLIYGLLVVLTALYLPKGIYGAWLEWRQKKVKETAESAQAGERYAAS